VERKGWIIFIAVVIALLGGLVVWARVSNPSVDVSKIDVNKIQPATAQDGEIADHVLGSTAGKVTLIEYGDYECPYCGETYPQLKTVMNKYSENVTFIFRNFPLTTIHPNARAAAAVAEAAGLQGKYWEMHDQLYTNQNDWVNLSGTQRTTAFTGYAQNIGLNITQFNKDLANSNRINEKISFDQALGNKLGINSTPSIYLNGSLISTDVSQDLESGTGSKLEALLDQALKAANLPVPTS